MVNVKLAVPVKDMPFFQTVLDQVVKLAMFNNFFIYLAS